LSTTPKNRERERDRFGEGERGCGRRREMVVGVENKDDRRKKRMIGERRSGERDR
jgi:hypothetical protein